MPSDRDWVWHNRTVTSHDRAGSLKVFLSALALLLAAPASSQYLEKVVTLPDSFGRPRPLTSIVHNPVSDMIYIGDDSGSILVVDAATKAKLVRVQTSGSQFVDFLTPIPGTHKLYSAGSYRVPDRDTSVKVIDCISNSVVREIPVPGGCGLFAGYDSVGGKAYYVGYDTSYVANAIDVVNDSVVASIVLPKEAIMAACLNTRSRKIYLTGSFRHSRRFTVIDARGDSVLKTTTLDRDPTVLGYNPTTNKVYCGYSGGVYIFDGDTDSLIGERDFNGSPCVIGCNPDANKVYCGIGGGGTAVYILNGSTDSTIAVVDVGHGPRAMLYNPVDSNMYVACSDGFELSVIDGRGDSVLANLPAGLTASFLTMDDARNLVYCAAQDGLDVSVTHGTTFAPAGVIYTGIRPRAVCYDSVGDKVYIANWDPLGCVTVVNCQSNEAVANVRVGEYPQSLCYNPLGNKVYCANDEWSSIGRISVIDAGADTMLATLTTAASPHDVCYSPARNRVYCGHSVAHVTAIDAGPDTIATLIPTPYDGTDLWYVPTYKKLYHSMPLYRYFGVIDCATESLTAALIHCIGEAFVGHRASGKVYFISHDTLKAIDGKGDTLVPPTLQMGTAGSSLCWNSANDKLYWGAGESLSIIDCAADTIVTSLGVGARSLFYDSIYNRVYCSGASGVVTVVDGATNQVIETILAALNPGRFAYSPRQGRLYVPDLGSSSVAVIRTAPPGVNEASLEPRGHGRVTRATLTRVLGRTVSPEEMVFDVAGRRVDVHGTRSGATKLAPGVYVVVPGPNEMQRKVVVVR